MLLNLGRVQAKKVWHVQLVVGLVFSLLYAVLQGAHAGYSALIGALICWLACGFFFYQAFKHQGAQAAGQIMRGFYIGQFGKFAITVVLFVVAFVIGQVQPLALFLGYLVAQVTLWCAPLCFKKRVVVND